MDAGGQVNGGEQTAGSVPQFTAMWQPEALLNPRAASASSVPPVSSASASRLQTFVPMSSTAINGGSLAPDNVSFQFSNPSGSFATDFSGLLHDSGSGQPHNPHIAPLYNGGYGGSNSSSNGQLHHPHITPIFQNGFGTQIERLSNVQERTGVPQPKRRKTQTESDPPLPGSLSVFGGTNNSGLGEYIKQQQQQRQSDGEQLRSTVKLVETVDLTDGDNDSPPLQILEKDPAKNEEVCYGMIERAMINCHKVPAPKPGMFAILGGEFWPQVKVVLRRKQGDGSNTISVYDYTRQIFGQIDPKTAACLSGLLDSDLQIRTDCRIPSRKKQPGEQIGQSISRAVNIELMIYGPRRFAYTVGRHLSKAHMNLLSPPRVDAGVKVCNPLAKESRLPAVARFTPLGDGSPHPQPPPTVRTVEEIRNEVLGVFDSLPRSEDLPEADPCDLVTTPLLKHQRQALYFMTSREEDTIPDSSDTVVRSTWRCKKDQHGANVFYNVITNQSQRERPPPALGGILADMMGLGKTLSVLSLLANSKGEAEEWAKLKPVQPKAPEKKPSHSSKHFDLPRPHSTELTPLQLNGKATLLICPLSTVTNWEEQIKQHIKPNSISYHIYHGPSREKDPRKLALYDLVITTYGSVSSELNARAKQKRGLYPLEEIAWFRIVLDEAHMIREQNTLTFKAVCRLQASRRWAVTGTPVQNKLEDLASLLAFLRLKPFDEKSKFVQHIITPFKNADPEIVPKLRVLIDTITIRRLKDKINLPKRTDQVIKLQFDQNEQQVYDWFAKSTRDRVKVLTGQSIDQDRIAGRAMIHILRSILQLRLICAHGKDLLNDEDLAELKGMTPDTPIDLSDDEEEKPMLSEAKAYEYLYLMQEANNDSCAKCHNKLGSNEVVDLEADRQEDVLGYMSPASCFHMYCPACINTLLRQHDSQRCEDCCSTVKASFIELSRSRSVLEHESRATNRAKGPAAKKNVGERDEEPYVPHTKTRALVEDLKLSRQMSRDNPDEPPYKSVVFSGWTSHLDLIEKALKREGIVFTRLDGKMSRTARNNAMDDFRTKPEVQVILVSIMAGGLGLNLTSGNTVYVMEPQFNPAAEAQAVDRVHRLGQTREVRTVRYIMDNSFEEMMLALQDKKTKLANLSMDGRDKDKVMDRTEAARQRLLDLRSLFK